MLEFFTQFMIRENSFEQINRWFPGTGEELVPEWKAVTYLTLSTLVWLCFIFPSLAQAVWFHYIIKVPTKQKQVFSSNVIIKIIANSLLVCTLHTMWQREAHGSTLLLYLASAEGICWFVPPWVASSRYSCLLPTSPQHISRPLGPGSSSNSFLYLLPYLMARWPGCGV